MTDVPEELVEKAAHAVQVERDEWALYPENDVMIARAVLAAVLSDVRHAVAEETLREAADAWDSEDELSHMKALADERYRPGGPSMPEIWLRDRADRIAHEVAE